MMPDNDVSILEDILNTSEELQFFHQLGFLEHYLSFSSEENDVYKRIPRIAHSYAFECSNGCRNIYNQEGRDDNEESQYIFVMESEIMKDSSTSNCVEVGNIRELLEKDRFMDVKDTATHIN